MATQKAPRRGGTNDARDRLLAGIPAAERRLQAARVSTPVLEGGDGPPVVLLHGPGANAGHWGRVIGDLVATHAVVAPDLPGQGSSEVLDGPLDPERAIAWLDELIGQTCASPPLLVGHALGGAVAARYASDHGRQICGLVLVDTLGLVAFDPAPEFGLALHDFLAEPSVRTHEALWRQCALDLHGMRRRMGEHWEAFEAYNVDRARAPRSRRHSGVMEQFGGPPIDPAELERIAVPTPLIWGRHDLATPLEEAEAAAARYGWPLDVIEDMGDDPPVEQPEPFVRALRAADAAGGFAAAGFKGEIAGRGHPRYDELRSVFNGMVDRRPALIARCTDAQDVSAAVDFAREGGLPSPSTAGGTTSPATRLSTTA